MKASKRDGERRKVLVFADVLSERVKAGRTDMITAKRQLDGFIASHTTRLTFGDKAEISDYLVARCKPI